MHGARVHDGIIGSDRMSSNLRLFFWFQNKVIRVDSAVIRDIGVTLHGRQMALSSSLPSTLGTYVRT
jgi:hypothetical protein